MNRGFFFRMVAFLITVLTINYINAYAQNLQSRANEKIDIDESSSMHGNNTSQNKNSVNITSINGFNWIKIDQQNTSAYILHIREQDSSLLVGYWGIGIWNYTDYNSKWNQVNTLINSNIEDLNEFNDSTNLYVGVDCDGGFKYIYSNKQLIYYGGLGNCIEKMFKWNVNGINYLIGSSYSYGVLSSIDNGISWNLIFNEPNGRVWSILGDSSKNVLLGGHHGLYRTFDLIKFDTLFKFSSADSTDNIWNIIYVKSQNAYYMATTNSGLLKSFNLTDWQYLGFKGIPLHALWYDDLNQILYVGEGERLFNNGITGGVYIGSGLDNNWIPIGLYQLSIQSIVGDGKGNIYAGVADYGVWKLNPCSKYSLVYSDTIKTGKIDTVYLFNRLLRDTLKIIKDSLITKYDTVNTVIDSIITKHDTVNVTTHDTTFIKLTVRDTVTIIVDSIIFVRDTIYIDTCNFFRLIQCNDTLFLTFNNIKTYYTIAPNPVSGNSISLIASSNRIKQIQLLILNDNGNIVEKYDQTLFKGEQIVTIPANLKSGNYYLWIRDPDSSMPTLLKFIKLN